VIFYAKGGGLFTYLMLASIAFNYGTAIAVERVKRTAPARSKALVGMAVAINLIVLGIFKYANFFVANVNAALTAFDRSPIGIPEILLPIGISFFTFHAISYVVDVYRGDATAQKSPVHAALYLLLFPQLIAGPIIRYRTIADQLARRVVTLDDFAEGVRRFVIGLGKKVLIANVVAVPADRIFTLPTAQLDAAHAWLGVICYTLQIYFDFSGYSDMAIGLGRMFGFHFPENFRWPYIADTVQEFWRRWHMSLSSWFRDYLYVPLGGNRVSRAQMYRNLVTVFFLCGLWHGASWNFVIWGLFHGTFLVVERLGLAAAVKRLWLPLRHAYLMLVVMIGWVFFRADTLPTAMAFLRTMFGLQTAVDQTPFTLAWYLTPELWLALLLGVAGSAPIIPALSSWRTSHLTRWRAIGFDAAATASLMVILVAAIMQMAARTYNPFIYFRF
jgi:alginate O-acetyltransferase complex protein AlgI